MLAKLILCLSMVVYFTISAYAQSFESVKAEIYSKLDCCPCKDAFIQCLCPEAKAMKAYIEALLEAGIGKDEIYYKVAKKYSLKVVIDPQVKAGIEKRFLEEAGAKRPQLVLETHSFDFGQLHKGQKTVKKTFTIFNKGTAALVIDNIRTSCGCVSVSLAAQGIKSPFFGTFGADTGWEAILEPGKTGKIEVVIDLQHSSIVPGKLERQVRIASNDPLYPETVIMLTGYVLDPGGI